MKKLSLLFISLILFVAPANAQQFSIVATVNDSSISNFELYDRLELNIRSSGISDSPEIRKKIMVRTMQTLINEKLQKELSKELKIKVSKNEKERAINIIKTNNKIEDGKFDAFLISQKIKKKSFMTQLQAQIIWQKIMAKKITPFITISDFEIAQATEQLGKSQKSTDVELYEIFLAIEDPSLKTDVMQLAKNLINEIKAGASFQEVAKEFSVSNSARGGGKLGWIGENNLEKSIAEVVSNTKIKSLTPPVMVKDGVRIFYINDRKTQESEINPQQIRQFLHNQKVDLESRKLMKKLRSQAMIEIKI